MRLLEYNSKNHHFCVNEHNFISVYGQANSIILKDLLYLNNKNYIRFNEKELTNKLISDYRKNVFIVTFDNINIFTSETVEDELAYGLENVGMKPSKIRENINELGVKFNLIELFNADPTSIGTSNKALLKVVSALLCNPKVLVLDNILCCLNKTSKKILVEYLIEYVKNGNSVINFTNDIEDSLYGNYILLNDKNKVIVFDRTIRVLNEEKLMNRLGLFLPFIFDLNKQLMLYGIIDDFHLTERSLVDSIWK